ncbi:glycosyl hydrolase, partial [Ruminococcus sp.]|uniref:glycosyl hydrolase n=1 Tax=Ruminococcus sp. TaxID=41978 RepID=UPI003AB5EF3B
MRGIMKRTVAAVMAVLIACAAAGCSSTGNSSSGSSSAGETTTTTAPVVEDMGNIDLSDVTTEYDVPEDFSYESEAEKGTLLGGAAVLDKNFLGKFSGDGFVSIGSSGDMVEFEIDFPAKGSYNITLTMAADGEGQSNLITVDGAALTNFTSTTTEFGDTMAENVLIDEGTHKVGIKGDNGHIYIDKIKITPAPAIDLSQYEVSNQLSNPNASDEAKRLYNFLTDVYGKYTISGQFSGDNEGKDSREFKEIKKHTGKTPAILGLDVLNLSNSALAHGAGGGDMVPLQAMDWYNNENGIVSLCWHWYAPEKNLEKNGGAWWQGFYSEYTDFDLAKALSGEDKEGYDSIIADLDHMAGVLKELADANVPILWRPLHEAAGDPKYPGNAWFWWGSAGKDAYIQLWKLMYDKFTNEYGLNNLIWVWNAQNPDWYPGDEYVDIMGYDCYPAEQDSSSQKWYYDLVKSSTSTKKIIAMTENGSMFDPDGAFNDGTRWAWFSTWNGEFCIKDKQLSDQYTTFDEWNKIYNSERVLTLDELPNLKCYPMDTEKYLEEHKYAYKDFGCNSDLSCDYPDYAHPLAEAVESGEVYPGIAICGSGEGMAITLNKHQGVRAGLAWNKDVAE